MENRTIFIAFLIAWGTNLVAILWLALRLRKTALLAALSLAVPTIIAVSMFLIFYVGEGTTVAQFAAGSPATESLWSLWFRIWPLLLLLSFASIVAHFFFAFRAAVRWMPRNSLLVALPGLAMSMFAFYVVCANFPDA